MSRLRQRFAALGLPADTIVTDPAGYGIRIEPDDIDAAIGLYHRVLGDATRLSLRYEQARALDGLARCLRHTDPGQARRYAGRALALFRQVDSPDRRETEKLLAELG